MECEFLKLVPRSRMAAMVGALSPVTLRERNPSGTNRTRLCGLFSCAAAPCSVIVEPAISAIIFKRGDLGSPQQPCIRGETTLFDLTSDDDRNVTRALERRLD